MSLSSNEFYRLIICTYRIGANIVLSIDLEGESGPNLSSNSPAVLGTRCTLQCSPRTWYRNYRHKRPYTH